MTKTKLIKTFARRIGKSLRVNNKRLLDEVLPTVSFNQDEVFPQLKKVLEIGFGDGELILDNAKSRPQDLFIGAEPYLNGVAKVLKSIEQEAINNIRIFNDDVRLLLQNIDNNYFDEIYIICPDPWPKRRQYNKRLIQTDFIKELLLKIKHSGIINIATDHFDYAKWIYNILFDLKLITNLMDDYKKLPSNWLYTKYQKFGLEKGGEIYYFCIRL